MTGADTPAVPTTPECGYECPYSEEGHGAMNVDHPFEARSTPAEALDAIARIDAKLASWETECRVKGVWRESDPDAQMTRWIRAITRPCLSPESDR